MTCVWYTTDTREHESRRHDERHENRSGCPYPTVTYYRAYEAKNESDDGDERDDCAKFGPIDGCFVGNWDWGMDGQLFGQGSGFKPTGHKGK